MPMGRADQCPQLGVERTQCGRRLWAVHDRACVKTHTSAKCRKHNSPARHRTSLVQYDLTPTDAIAQRYFYVWRDRWSFRTAKVISDRSKHCARSRDVRFTSNRVPSSAPHRETELIAHAESISRKAVPRTVGIRP